MFFFAVLYQTLSKEKSLKPLRFQGFFEISALGELGSATGGFQAVFLTLLHTRIAGEEAGALERRAEFLVHLEQSAGYAVPDGAWPLTPPPTTVATMSTLPLVSVVFRG